MVKRKKCVSFAPYKEIVANIRPPTFLERKAIWYSKNDLIKFKRDTCGVLDGIKMARRLHKEQNSRANFLNCPLERQNAKERSLKRLRSMENQGIRGLERALCANRQRERILAIKVVLECQRRLRLLKDSKNANYQVSVDSSSIVLDPITHLALVASSVSKKARDNAYEMGQKDFCDVYFESEDDSLDVETTTESFRNQIRKRMISSEIEGEPSPRCVRQKLSYLPLREVPTRKSKQVPCFS